MQQAQLMKQPYLTIQQIQQSMLENQSFIEQLRTKLSSFSSLEVQSRIAEQQKPQSQTIVSSLKHIKKSDIEQMIAEISQVLDQLISQKLQYQMNQLIEYNNNLLLQIKENLVLQQKQNQSVLHQNNKILEQDKNEMSFSDVHRLIAQEKRKFENINENINDAELEKSLSSLVDFKFQSIEQKVVSLAERLKNMEDKYETNLKSIWNVLSMTEGAVFDFINKERQKEKQKQKEKKQSSIKEQKPKKPQTTEKKSTIFNFW